jgi:hypothetical protein
VEGEIVLFSGSTGSQIRRAAGTGFVKTTAGVFGTAAAIAAGDIAAADKQGNGSKVAMSGVVTPSRCAAWDASGTLVSASGECSGTSSATPRVLKAGYVNASTNATSNTALETIPITLSDLAVGDIMHIQSYWRFTGTAGHKHWGLAFGGLQVTSQTSVAALTAVRTEGEMMITGSSAQLLLQGITINNTGAVQSLLPTATPAVNITAGGTSNLTLIGRVTNAADTITLVSYSVILIKAQ